MRKSLVSLVALGLFLGAPALADTAMAESTSTKATSTQQQSSLSSEEFETLLKGFEEPSNVNGRLARATTLEGNQVLVLVGPEDLESGGSVEAQDSDIQDRFQEAGFTGVEMLEDAHIARAELDDDHYIFALSPGRSSGSSIETGSAAGQTGTTGSTTMGQTDTQTGTMGSQSGSTTTGQTGTAGSTTMGQADTQTGTTGSQSGPTTTGQTGTAGSTTMGQADTQSDTTGAQSGSTATGETGTTGSTTMSQTDTQSGTTGTQSGSTTLGQADTQSGTTGTQSDSTMSQSDTQTGTTGTGQVGRALSEPDAERIVSDLKEAGLEEAKEFKGRLLRASTEDGSDVFFIITSKDMDSDAEVEISEDEIRSKLDEANLENIEFIDNAKIVRGSLEDDNVFVLAGDLMGTRK